MQKIDKLFIENGFKKEKLYIDKEELPFNNVYINQSNTEVYIVEKLDLNDLQNNKIEEYQDEILWFENFTENYFLKYNMNLNILYDEQNIEDEFKNYIQKYERDSNICKKIFLDINNKDNLCILPFINIEVQKEDDSSADTLEKLECILKSKDLLSILIQEDLDDSYIESNVVDLLGI